MTIDTDQENQAKTAKTEEANFNANLEYFFDPEQRKLFLDIVSETRDQWAKSRDENQTADFQFHGIRYHSARDPFREAKRQLEGALNSKTQHLICIGAGLGFLPEAAFQEKRVDSILLLESDPEVLFYLMRFKNWRNIAGAAGKTFQIHFSPSPEKDNLEDILPFFRNKNTDAIGVYSHRPAHQACPEKYGILKKRLVEILEKRMVNQATLIKFQEIWNKNIALNAGEILRGNTLSEFINRNKGNFDNIVIAGAGPSLGSSMEDLKKYRARFLLVAADTAFIPLIRNQIVPDIVIAADPQWINRHFAYCPEEEIRQPVWILDPVVSHGITHRLTQAKAAYLFWDNPFYLDLFLRETLGPRGEIAHGGSVTTNGFDLARQLKAGTIILIGQDLSFSNGLAHTKGAALESLIYQSNHRFATMENHNYRQLTALEPRYVIGKKDNTSETIRVATNDKMLLFIKWFNDQAHVTKNISLYNATAKGVRFEGYRDQTLAEILKEEKELTLKLNALEINPSNINTTALSIIRRVEQLIKDVRKIGNLYRENAAILRKGAAQNSGAIIRKNSREISKYEEANRIVSLNAQKEILNITEGPAQKNNEEALYVAMALGSKKLLYLLNKILIIVHNLEKAVI